MMRLKKNEDYYRWCCDWCDSENRVLWTKLQDGSYCGACHRPMNVEELRSVVSDRKIVQLCYAP